MSTFKRNALSVIAIAALTMTATLAVITSGGVNAADDEPAKQIAELAKIRPEISQPTLSAENVSFKLTMDKEKYAKGEKPVLSVEVTNNSDEEVTRAVEVLMKTRNLMERSRMPAVAVVVWKKTADVTLKPGETKTIELETDVEVKESESVSFSMKHADTAVVKEVEVESESAEVEISN